MKTYFFISLIMVGFISCKNDSPTSTNIKKGGYESSSHISSTSQPPTLISFNDDCEKTSIISIDQGLSGKIHLDIENATPDTHSIGYYGNLSNVYVTFKYAVIDKPQKGGYSFDVILRDREKCAQNKILKPNCNLAGKRAFHKYGFDTIKNVSFVVTDPAFKKVDKDSLGDGGGIVGKVIKGEGFIGKIASLFIKPEQLEGMVPKNSPIITVPKGLCKDGIPTQLPSNTKKGP